MPKASININDFGRGINTVKNSRDLSIGESPSITNFDTSNRGELRPRSFFNTSTTGTALRLGANGVDVHTASINPGYGLYYFEADEATGLRGVTFTASGAVSDSIDDGLNIIFNAANDRIYINNDDFWTENNILSSATNFPVKIKVSGTSNNNGTFTVTGLENVTTDPEAFVIQGSTWSTSGNLQNSVLKVSESLTDENVSASTSVTIQRIGLIGDQLLALGNIDDSKVDVYADSSDSWSADRITVVNTLDTDEKPEYVFYYIDSSLRVADGNFRNESTPRWYGFIDRNQFQYNQGTSTENVRRTIEPNFYEEDNDLAPPTEFNLETTVNGSAEFPTSGSGWGFAINETNDEGEFSPGDYEFCATFIYDGKQESLIKKASGTKTLEGFKKICFNVYAHDNGTLRYPRRVTGGRVYFREAESRDPWVLIADIDIRRGVRASLVDEYKGWIEDGTGEYRITENTTAGDRDFSTTASDNHWVLFAQRPNIDTYESINGYSPNDTKQIAFGKIGSGYKTAVVTNRRTFVANVLYDDNATSSSGDNTEFQHYGDRIMFSEVGKYDLFPNFNFIDVVKGDGEDYVKLESYADRLLAYKQRTLQILNISSPSPSNWFLETTIQEGGVTNPYSVCKGRGGVIWANKSGVYRYDGSSVKKVTDGKISDSDWSSFSATNKMSLGYVGDTDQVIIMRTVSNSEEAYIYDIRSDSFVFAQDIGPNCSDSFEPPITNFVNDSTGKLIVAYDTESTNLGSAGANKVVLTNWALDEGYLNSYKLETPDITFGNLHKTKVVYKIYVHYKFVASSNALSSVDELVHTTSAPAVYYKPDQKGEWRPMLRGYIENSENVLPNARFDRYWLDWLGSIIRTDSSSFQNLDGLNLGDAYSSISLVSDGAGGRKLRADGSTSSGLLFTTSKVDKGVVYDTSMTLSNVTAGNVQFSFGGASGTARSTNNTFTEQITPTSTDTGFVFLNSSFAGDIESIIFRPRTQDQKGAYKVAVFSLEADSGVRCQSIAFKIEPSLTTAHQLHINDIQVEYRTIESQIA
tara:strand:- start:5530 stop:8637 length:3108 start_codon:yes stop_codon:yes gene_type:complete